MNNFNNKLDIDKINSQLERADFQKRRLILNIYKEYELYLNRVRDLIYISVEKGLNDIYSYLSINDNFLNESQFFCIFEKKISKIIYTKLPLFTVEQLKIKEIEKNINKEFTCKSLDSSPKIKDDQKVKFQYEDVFQLEEPIQIQFSKDISNTSEYYQTDHYEKFLSIDLDSNDHNNYLTSNNNIENLGIDKQFISSLVELIEEVKVEKPRHSENHNINDEAPRSTLPGTVNSRRLAPNPVIGGPMISNNLKGKHIYEVITIPFPHFINVSYEVVFWTSYTLHMNQMIEKFVSSYTGTRNQFKIESDKGYWFVAYPDNTLSNRDNFEDFADSERIVRYAFNMTVPGYIVAPESPGSMRPFRKFVSAPDINFGVFTANAPIVNHPEGLPNPTGDIDKFILNDVNEIDAAGNIIDDERFSYLKAKTAVKNPFTGDDQVEYLKILTTNQRKGETVVSARIVTKIDDLQG